MNSFAMVPLEELCTFENGDRSDSYPSKNDFKTEGIPFLNAGNISDNRLDLTTVDFISKGKYDSLRAGKVQRGDLVYCLRGSIGKCAKSNIDLAAIASSLVIIRPKPGIDADYLRFLLTSPYFMQKIENYDNGSVQGNLSVDTLKAMTVPVLAQDAGLKASRVLQTIDDTIDNNYRMCVELDNLVRTIYDYWFIQYEFPTKSGTPYSSSGGVTRYSKGLKREIPSDWTEGTIGDLGIVVSGATPSTSIDGYYSEQGIAWITPNDLSEQNGRMFVSHGKRDVSEVGLASCSAVKMPRGSIIMSSRAPIGYLAISSTACCTNQGCKSIIPSKDFGPWYTYYTLRKMMPIIEAQGSGTTFKEISGETLMSIGISIPPLPLINLFTQTVADACTVREQIEAQISQLESLRKLLLPMLINGQVLVGD